MKLFTTYIHINYFEVCLKTKVKIITISKVT